MKFEKKSIPDVIRVVPTVHVDARGFFMETWQSRQFADGGIDVSFVQDNFSSSSRGTLRGLHYQIEKPQGKLVRVVRGQVFDVAVDLRRSSKHFGKWVGEELSAENKHQLWVEVPLDAETRKGVANFSEMADDRHRGHSLVNTDRTDQFPDLFNVSDRISK